MTPEPFARAARIAANTAWRDADWARARLQPHAGKAVRFEIWPLGFAAITLAIGPEGDWVDASAGQEAAATVRITPAVLARWAGTPDKPGAALGPDCTGEPDLVAAIRDVHDVLPLAIEEQLSKVLGPIAAHGLASAARAMTAWPGYAAERVGAGLAAYWTHESAALPGRPAFESFRKDIAELEARVDRAAVQAAAL